jgi:glycosidase
VEAQTGDPGSMLEHYRRLLTLRRALPALHRGHMELLDDPDEPHGIVRWRRWVDEEGDEGATAVEVQVNFTGDTIEVPGGSGAWLGGTADPSAPPAPGDPLGPDEARIIAVEHR